MASLPTGPSTTPLSEVAVFLRRPAVLTGAPLLTGLLTAGALTGCGSGEPEDSARAAAPSATPPAATPTRPNPKASLYGGLIKAPETSARPKRRSTPSPEPTRAEREPRTAPSSPAAEREPGRLTVVVPAQGRPSCAPARMVARTGETWTFVVKARGQATITVAGQSFDTAPIAATDKGMVAAEVKMDQPGTYPVTSDPALQSPCTIVIR